MARLPRLTVPGYPHHVIQRGNNRQAIVRDDEDRQFLLALIVDSARKHGVSLHAWVLMDNHFHLLLTPDSSEGLSKMMQAIGRAYVRRFNNRHQRTGTLWEGRYKSTVVQSDRYVLACMAYIDLNPVRAGMVVEPQQHTWSSHRHYVGQVFDRDVVPPPTYWGLGNTPFAREANYAAMVHAGLARDQQAAITDATLHGWALGDQAFLKEVQRDTDRRVVKARRGRPPVKQAVDN